MQNRRHSRHFVTILIFLCISLIVFISALNIVPKIPNINQESIQNSYTIPHTCLDQVCENDKVLFYPQQEKLENNNNNNNNPSQLSEKPFDLGKYNNSLRIKSSKLRSHTEYSSTDRLYANKLNYYSYPWAVQDGVYVVDIYFNEMFMYGRHDTITLQFFDDPLVPRLGHYDGNNNNNNNYNDDNNNNLYNNNNNNNHEDSTTHMFTMEEYSRYRQYLEQQLNPALRSGLDFQTIFDAVTILGFVDGEPLYVRRSVALNMTNTALTDFRVQFPWNTITNTNNWLQFRFHINQNATGGHQWFAWTLVATYTNTAANKQITQHGSVVGGEPFVLKTQFRVVNRIGLFNDNLIFRMLPSQNIDVTANRNEFELILPRVRYDMVTLELSLYHNHHFYIKRLRQPQDADDPRNPYHCYFNGTKIPVRYILKKSHVPPYSDIINSNNKIHINKDGDGDDDDFYVSNTFVQTLNITFANHWILPGEDDQTWVMRCDYLYITSFSKEQFTSKSSVLTVTAQSTINPGDSTLYPTASIVLFKLKFNLGPSYVVYWLIIIFLFFSTFFLSIFIIRYWNQADSRQNAQAFNARLLVTSSGAAFNLDSPQAAAQGYDSPIMSASSGSAVSGQEDGGVPVAYNILHGPRR